MRLLPVVVFLICAMAGGAGAQVRSSPSAAGEPRQAMTVTLALYGAGATGTEHGDAESLAGYRSDTDALLTYARRSRRTSLSLSGRSALRYDANRSDLGTVRHEGTFALSATGARTAVRVTQNGGYSPAYQFGAAPAPAGAAAADTERSFDDHANARIGAYWSTTAVDVTRTISRRSTLSLSYSRRHTAFVDRDLGLTAQAFGGRLTRRLTRHAALRAGYGVQFASYGVRRPAPARAHDIDLGIDYGRSLSFSRRTSVSFGTGSSVVTEGRRTMYRVSGNAALAREIGRAWRARLTYRRGVELLEGFAAPVMSDAVGAGIGGLLGRQLVLASSVGFTRGTVSSTSAGGGLSALIGAVGIRLPLGRRAAFETQYFYSRQRFGRELALPGLAPSLNRQGVRAGITWSTALR